jgi:hypothetical protein
MTTLRILTQPPGSCLRKLRALSPEEVLTYVTPEHFGAFWQVVKEHTGLLYGGLHFGHYIAALFCPNLSLLHAAKLSICAGKGVALAR